MDRLLTAREATERYRFASVHSFYQFLRAHPYLPVMRKGTHILIDPAKFDRALEVMAKHQKPRRRKAAQDVSGAAPK